ncbi:MAG: chromosomal replication initiator protein DnaA [Dehalococcoidia bacterium]|nr:chromosomal replication initiator protein DnaA [Dehalococcoidia bacterium]
MANKVWSASLGYLEMVVPETTYKTWLENTEGVSISGDLLVVSTQSIFAIEMLSQRLNKTIKDAIYQTSNKNYQIQYTLSGDEKNNRSKTTQGAIEGSWINPRFDFKSFITGSSNYLAYAAAKKICELPGEIYNPLYLYSEWGLGKTHLIQSIAKTLKTKGLKVLSVSGETFVNEFVKSIKNKSPQKMNKYREADVFILDDIDFFVGKKQTIELFIHIINQLSISGKQIVVTSYNHPSKLDVSKRLTSILKSGLIVKIQTPDKETSKKYITKSFKKNGVNISEELIDFIGSKKYDSFSEIEGIIKSLVAHSDLLNTEITESMVRSILHDYKLENIKDINISKEKIFGLIKYMFGITEREIIGRKTDKKTSFARQVAAYLLIEKSNFSMAQAGKVLGNRNHSTIIYSVNKIKKIMLKDVELKQEIEKSLIQN